MVACCERKTLAICKEPISFLIIPNRLLAWSILPPLIGSPQSTRPFHEIRTRALSDAGILIDNGIDGVIIENYGDVPFQPDNYRASHGCGTSTRRGTKFEGVIPTHRLG